MFHEGSHGKGRNADTEGRERMRERVDNFLVIKMGRPVGEESEEENVGLEIQRTWVGR